MLLTTANLYFQVDPLGLDLHARMCENQALTCNLSVICTQGLLSETFKNLRKYLVVFGGATGLRHALWEQVYYWVVILLERLTESVPVVS